MNNSMWTWITAAVVVILVVIGLWWWHTKGAPMTASTNLGYTASTTEAITGNNVPHTAPVHAQTRLGSVVAVLNSIPDASRFAQLLGKAGVASKLTGK